MVKVVGDGKSNDEKRSKLALFVLKIDKMIE